MKIYKISRHRIGIDGNGITDLVAMAGCPLSCKYCLNKRLLSEGEAKDVSIDYLLTRLYEDACYMMATGGGVTFGGGEPLLQYKELIEFAEKKPEWMHMNIETSLNVPEGVKELLPYVDEWIIDIKSMNPKIYEDYTGGSYSRMIKNLSLIGENSRIRVPDIPNYSIDTNIDEEILRRKGFKNIERFEYLIR